MKKPYVKRLRLPMRLIDGQWELEFGGEVPVPHGTIAELSVDVSKITDPSFVRRMRAKSSIKILDQGTTLRAYLATKGRGGLSQDQQDFLKPSAEVGHEIAPGAIDNWSSGGIDFVDVVIGKPTEKQKNELDGSGGGLWMMTEGMHAVGLQSAPIELPEFVSKFPAISLNHAFTLLSEVYESWRKSHTGNVYSRFLYKEKNGRWYPLETLRDVTLVQKEQEIAAASWQEFLRRMKPHQP